MLSCVDMQWNVITIFPQIIASYCGESILKRAQESGAISVMPVNLRDFSGNKHGTVDDTPYGGGAGMVMKPEPVYAALQQLDAIPFHKASGLSKVKKLFSGSVRKKKRTLLLSPRGRQFDQRMAEALSGLQEITLICGRYEGVDQRVSDYMVDEEVSVGPYVLAGGELGALVIIEAVSRLIPGVLGNPDSLKEETFGRVLSSEFGVHRGGMTSELRTKNCELKEYAQYTKPADFNGWKVPEVLLSGNHQRIKEWRESEER